MKDAVSLSRDVEVTSPRSIDRVGGPSQAFRTFLGKIKPGSMDEYGNILCMNGFGEEKLVSEGLVGITAPVSIRRWDTYLKYGWKPKEYVIDLGTEKVTGLLYRAPGLTISEVKP